MADEKQFHDEFYADEAERILASPLMLRLQRRMVRHFVRSAGVGLQSDVLSLGCGDGAKERLLAPQVRKLVGVDISEVAVSNARSKCASAGLTNATFGVADVAGGDPGLPTGPFDAVCAFSLLHHLDDQAIVQVLSAARVRLKPGGVFYSLDPSARRFVRLFTGLVRGAYDRCHSPDERELDPRHMCDLFREAGYVGTAVDYVDFFALPFAWLCPGCPGWLAPAVDVTDLALVSLPGLRLLSDAFSVVARGPS